MPANELRHGDRVLTPYGRGTVAYVRMAAPDYREPEAVSVILDAKRGQLGYAGTIVPAASVSPEPLRAVGEALEQRSRLARTPSSTSRFSSWRTPTRTATKTVLKTWAQTLTDTPARNIGTCGNCGEEVDFNEHDRDACGKDKP